jgi:hypothetical protein
MQAANAPPTSITHNARDRGSFKSSAGLSRFLVHSWRDASTRLAAAGAAEATFLRFQERFGESLDSSAITEQSSATNVEIRDALQSAYHRTEFSPEASSKISPRSTPLVGSPMDWYDP